MAAAAELPLAKDTLLAAAVAATLLAFSRHAADQPVLASRDATAVLLQLLQVRSRQALRSLSRRGSAATSRQPRRPIARNRPRASHQRWRIGRRLSGMSDPNLSHTRCSTPAINLIDRLPGQPVKKCSHSMLGCGGLSGGLFCSSADFSQTHAFNPPAHTMCYNSVRCGFSWALAMGPAVG